MEYITKTPDFCGGFVYTCMENMHVVKRDNDGNLLSSTPIDLIKKGLLTEKGEIIDFTDNRVLLQKDGKDVTADRYLFNSYLLKKSMQEPEMKKGLLSFLKPKAPKPEAPAATPMSRKGEERPGHKYIQRKPNATGDGYIYLYELPSGKQQWQDNDGNTVGDKEHEKYSEFKVGDHIQHEGQSGKIIDGSDNIYAVQFGDKTKLIHKGQHLEKLHRDLNLKVGDSIDVNGTKGRIKEIGSKIALVETDKGNFFYKLSSPIVKKTPEEGLKAERDMQIKVMEGEPTGDSEKLKGNYQNSKSYNNWKFLADSSKLTRKNDLRYEDHFDSPMGQLKVSHSFDPETKEATVNINGTDNPSLFLNKKNYKIKNVAADGMFLEDENGATDFKYFDDIEKDVDRKINVIEKQEKFDSLKIFFDPKTGKTIATKKTSREQAVKELNDPDKKLQAIQDAIREKEQAEGSRWKRSKETGPVQSDADKAKIEQQNEENRQKIKEVLTSPEFADYSADMQQRGFKQSANPLISNKEVQFGGQKYKVRSEYDWKTGEHNNTVDGPFKELTIGNNKHQIYDISGGTVTYVDKDGMHKQISKDELETINGKTLLSPTNAFKGVIGSGTKIFMPDNEQRTANYAIMDLGDIKASHNEKTFLPTEGYPQENGVSVNDRDYENDKNAQKMVDDIAQGWDSRTITNSKEAGQNIIVSGEGFVVSGNNRIMSAKVAAEKYPQKWAEYQADLKNELTNYGFAPQDIEGMKNPVLVKIDHDIKGLSKAELGKYNQDVTKGKDEVQKGMQYADILSKSPKTMNALLSVVNSVENFSDIYRNAKVQSGIMKTLTDSGIILPQKLPEYFNSETEQLTPQGRDLFETVMLGSVLEADALRATSVDGVKALAGNIKENVGVFARNAGLRNGYSLKSTLNNAVNLQSRYAKTSEGRGSDFNTFLSQIDMFDNPPSRQDVAMNILAKKEPRVMKSVMKAYNDSAEVEQEGGGMFGEAVPPDEVFHSKIVYGKNPYNGKDVFTPEEQEIIKSFQPKIEKKSFAVSIKNSILKAFNKAFKKSISIDSPKLIEGAKQESEHENLYNELKKRLEAEGVEMPMSKEVFFRFIAAQHVEENPDYYELLKKYVEKKVEKSIILFGKAYPLAKSIDKNKNELLPSKKNPEVDRWQKKTSTKGKIINQLGQRIDSRLATEISDIVNRLSEEYNLQEDVYIKVFEIQFKSRRDPTAFARRVEGRLELSFNIDKLRFKEKFDDNIKNDIAKGFFPDLGLSAIESLVIHEFTHILQMATYSEEEVNAKYVANSASRRAVEICEYAKVNRMEEEACAFMLEYVGMGNGITDEILKDFLIRIRG